MSHIPNLEAVQNWHQRFQHGQQNPNYPYAKGYPLIEPPDPRDSWFHPDQIVVPQDWWRNNFGHGATRCIVLNVRRIKYYKRDSWITQVLVVDGRGEYHWSAQGHFTALLN